jgi:NAD(P)-dependent dehydrogenase (short-subunit alcohol dehydrogenase family)
MSHGRFDNPVVAALAGFLDLFRKQDLSDKLTDEDRFDGKTVMVTGANSGLGFALAVDIARRGGRVIMAGRSQIPGAGEKVKKLSGSDKVEMRMLDLSKIDSIHSFCDGLARDNISLDVSILNAGVALPKARKTDSGQEEMFFVNYLSNVILTNLLLNNGVISRAGFRGGPNTGPNAGSNGSSNGGLNIRPRIIFISSDSHRGSSYIDYDEFGTYYEYGQSKGINDYSYFKLILNTYATELSRRLNPDGVNVGVHVICPGPVHSNIIKEAPFLLRIVLGAIFKVIFRSPARAAPPVVYMSVTGDYEGQTNKYPHIFKPKEMDPKVYEPGEGKKLWEKSVTLWKSLDNGAQELQG